MIKDKKVIVVMPAYNAAKTLEKTYREIPHQVVDTVIVTDDSSHDETVDIARKLGLQEIIIHPENKGYGANQKTCYNRALELGADIIIMLHPDYQYTPKLIEPMAHIIASNLYPVVLGSRILGKGALKGGMPLPKYIANRILTLFQNWVMNQKLSEYHTGYRAFSADILRGINFNENSNDFVFDNELLAQLLYQQNKIAEITCPTKYFEDASSINLSRSIVYALGVIKVSLLYRLNKMGLIKSKLFHKAH